MVRRLFGLLVPFLGSAGAVYLATRIFDQDRFDHVVSLQVALEDRQATAQTIALVTVIFGLVNLLVKPIVRLFTFPIRILSFGLFSLVINGGMLLLTGYVANLDRVNLPFHVKLSPWVIAAAAFIGIAAGIFNWIGDKITTRTKTKVKVVERVVERVVEVPAPQVPQYQPRAATRPAPAARPQYAPPPPPPPPPAPAPQYAPPPAPPQYGPPPTYGPAPQYGPPPTYGQPPQYGPPPQPGQTYGQDPSGQGTYGSGSGQ